MTYTYHLSSSVQDEIDRCVAFYGAQVREDIEQWMNELCKLAAADEDDEVSFPLLEHLNKLQIEGIADDLNEFVDEGWSEASFLEKIKALYETIKGREPWTVLITNHGLVFESSEMKFPRKVDLIYGKNRVNRELRAIEIYDLPPPPPELT